MKNFYILNLTLVTVCYMYLFLIYENKIHLTFTAVLLSLLPQFTLHTSYAGNVSLTTPDTSSLL